MAGNFGDPYSGPTNAQLAQNVRINPIDIGSIVAAVIRNNQQNSQQMNQGLSSLGSSLGKGMANYGQQQQQGLLSQYQNIGLHDDSEALTTPEQDDLYNQMKPQTQIQADAWLQHQQQQGDTEDLKQQLIDNRSAAMGRTGGSGSSLGNPNIFTDDESGNRYLIGSRGGFQQIKTPPSPEDIASGKIANSNLTTAMNNLTKMGAPYGKTAQDMTSTDVTTPYNVGFWNKDYSQQIGTDQAQKDAQAHAVFPDGSVMKASDYLNAVPRIQQAQKLQQMGPAQSQSSPNDGGAGRPIDLQTAQKYLDAAGGDTDKARQMAAQDGYTGF